MDDSELIADLRLFAEQGGGFWRVSQMDLPALEQLPSVREAVSSSDPNSRLDAIEVALETACSTLASPLREIAEDHLGLSEHGRKARSITSRRRLAAKRLYLDESNYRKPHRNLIDGRFESYEAKTLTLIAEALQASSAPADSSSGATQIVDVAPSSMEETRTRSNHPGLSRRRALVASAVAISAGIAIAVAVIMNHGNSNDAGLALLGPGSQGWISIRPLLDAGSIGAPEKSAMVKNGDGVQFEIVGRNRKATGPITGLQLNYRVGTVDGTRGTFYATLKGPGVSSNTVEASVFPIDGTKARLELEHVKATIEHAVLHPGGNLTWLLSYPTPDHGSIALPDIPVEEVRGGFAVYIDAVVRVSP